jgi:adenine-specific DNA glycosylase
MKRSERIIGFAEAIWEWYGRHKRTLPWRDLLITDDNERAYQVLVSEVMLQQTQVSRVQKVFKEFIDRFSSMEELSLHPIVMCSSHGGAWATTAELCDCAMPSGRL